MKHCQQEMTVIQNAWPVVCNFGWLIEADRNARKGKRYRAEVLNFTARLEDNLFTIQQGMMNGSYVLGPYRKLWVYVPKKMQARVIKIMATRLAELGDTVTGRDEIAQADKAYRDAIGGDEWPDWAEQGGEDDGEPYHTGGA